MSGCATIESPFASIQSPEVDSFHSLCMKSESNMGGYDGLDDESDSIFGKVPEVRPLVRDGPQSRYVRGVRAQFSVDDLRPPPLRCGEKSLIEFLREGPPENCFHTPSPSLTAGSAVERSNSITPKKSQSIGRSSLASVRRFLSMSPKQQDRSDRPKHIPIVTAQTAFTIPSPTSSSLSEQFSPWFTVSNSLMTPPLSRTTTNSAGPTTIQHELSAQRSFHHTETTSPTHNSRGASSSFGHSTHSSRSQIYGQPPAAMVSPVIPRKVTGEHLSLTSFPPVSKEDIAKLPKEIEPTLPSPDMSPFASRHHSRQTSLRHLSSNSPSAEAFPGLSPQMRTSNPDTNNEDGRAFNLSAPPSAHQRPACYTYPIHTGGSARKSAETKIAANFTALARIQEDNVTMIGPSFENPRPARRPNSSSQAAAHAIPKAVVTQSMAKLKDYFAICTPESIHAARIAISSEEERLERLALIRHLTGTADGDVPNRRPRNPNHGRQYYARNLWCTHHTQSCSLCDAACCVMMEVVEVESETTDVYCKNLAKEAGDIIEACAQPSDAPTFLQCGECCRIVCPECIGECPVETCMLMACKYCKPTPWEPCSVHNLI